MTSEPKFSPTLQASTAHHLATWARHSQAREIVGRAATALAPPARVMPLKGVLLGALGIVHAARRQLRDADVLVDGVGLTQAVRRLGRAGFEIVDVPWSYGYISLAHASNPSLWLDLHVLLMPVGLGKLTPRYMFERARADERLFGARVYVPDAVALMVQLLANVVKDRVVQAFEHVPADLAALSRQLTPAENLRVASDLRSLGLAQQASLALHWAHSRSSEAGLAVLLEVLVPEPAERAALPARLAELEASDKGGLWARIRARSSADTLWLQGLATAFTVASIATHPLRKAWLRTNNRGDAFRDMR